MGLRLTQMLCDGCSVWGVVMLRWFWVLGVGKAKCVDECQSVHVVCC